MSLDFAWVLLVAVTGAVPILRGGVDETTAIAAAALSVLAFLLERQAHTRPASRTGHPRTERTNTPPLRVPKSLWPLLAICLSQTAMLIPLPVPDTSLRAFVWQALADPPKWAPLAANPGALAIDVVRLWCICLFALVIVSRTQRGRTNLGLFWAVTVSGTAQLALGLWRFGEPGDGLLRGPFVNANHQAAFLNVTWMCAVAVALMSRRSLSRGLALLAASAAMGGVVLTLSRAGIASGALGGGVLIALLRPRRGLRYGPVAIVVLGAAIATYVMTAQLSSRFVVRQEEKTRVWHQTISVIADNPLGTGRTGFGLAFEPTRVPDTEGGRWDYVENEYLQAFTDYGPIGGAAAILLWAWLLLRIVRNALKPAPGGVRSPRRAAVAAIAIALSAHAVFDFNWEIFGVALAVWLLISSLGRPGEPPFAPSAFSQRAPRMSHVFAVAVIAMGAAAIYGLRYTPRRLDALAADPMRRHRALVDLVRTRPLDAWALVGLGEEALSKRDVKDSLRFLNRATLIAPSWAEPHVSLARLFCAAKRVEQSHLEARLALERMRGGEERVFAILARCPGESLLDALPASVWPDAIAWAADADRGALLAALAREYDGHAPTTLAKLAASARRNKDRAAWEKWLAAFTDKEDPLRLAEIAEDAIALGHSDEAIAALDTAQRRATDAQRPALLERYATILIGAGDLERAEGAARQLAVHCASLSPHCRAYRLLRGALASARGQRSDALEQYKTILIATPEDVEATLRAADVLIAMQREDEAIELLRKNERLTQHPVVTQRRTELEAR